VPKSDFIPLGSTVTSVRTISRGKVVETVEPAPTFDEDLADWLVESWQCAVWNAEEVHSILKAGERGPLTAEQRYRLQSAISSLSDTLTHYDFSKLYLTPDEYDEQEALHLRSLGLEPLAKFAD
jgi:hypothetical protein